MAGEDEPDAGHDVKALLDGARRGDVALTDSLFTLLYSELHRLARRQLSRGGNELSLGTTTLLHETYLRVAGRENLEFPDRARFMGFAARVMRNLVVDHARSRRALKRGGGVVITTLPTESPAEEDAGSSLTRIGAAMEDLEREDPELAEVVDLKFFCGWTFGEIAALHGVVERTIQRRWEKARIFLYRNLRVDLTS